MTATSGQVHPAALDLPLTFAIQIPLETGWYEDGNIERESGAAHQLDTRLVTEQLRLF